MPWSRSIFIREKVKLHEIRNSVIVILCIVLKNSCINIFSQKFYSYCTYKYTPMKVEKAGLQCILLIIQNITYIL